MASLIFESISKSIFTLRDSTSWAVFSVKQTVLIKAFSSVLVEGKRDDLKKNFGENSRLRISSMCFSDIFLRKKASQSQNLSPSLAMWYYLINFEKSQFLDIDESGDITELIVVWKLWGFALVQQARYWMKCS